MGKTRNPLTVWFVGMTLGILVLGQAVLGVFFMVDQRELHRDILLKRASVLARSLSTLYAQELSSGDFGSLQRLTEGLRDDEDVIGIRIYDEHNVMLVRLNFADLRKVSTNWNPLHLPEAYEITEPIIAGARLIGKVEISYSARSANDIIDSLMLKPPLAQAAVFILAGAAIYHFSRRRIAEPIDRLHSCMREITSGNTQVSIPDMGGDEIGRLAEGLRDIVRGLSTTNSRLTGVFNTFSGTVKGLRGAVSQLAEGLRDLISAADGISASLDSSNRSRLNIAGIHEQLAESFSDNVSSLLEVKAMADEIVTSMETLMAATENSYTTVSQMAQTTKIIAMNATDIMGSVEKTSASIEEVISSVREVERSAKKSSSLAENVREKASKEGVNTVAEAVEGMNRITEKIEFTMEAVRKLHSRSLDVELILAVIREVAEKTNLLSLNAAILAERAGTHGKGFAVVAGEMRALSGRTASSTKEIESIIKTIQHEIEEVVLAIGEGMEYVNTGGKKVYAVGITMSDILEAAYNSALMTRTIEKATEEQVKALDHVEGAMIDISTMATSMARATEEQITGTGFMLERVGEVREIAETTKKGTDEQASGTTAIFKNFELANDQMDKVNNFVNEQKHLIDAMLQTIDEVRSLGKTNTVKLREVSVVFETLGAEIDLLRKEIAVFKAG